LDLVAVEISHLTTPSEARETFPQLEAYGLVANSDAHYLRDMEGRNTFKVKAPTVAELRQALAGENGREMWIDGVHV
jgi:PHP family Zn ribbon phosphoesterase